MAFPLKTAMSSSSKLDASTATLRNKMRLRAVRDPRSAVARPFANKAIAQKRFVMLLRQKKAAAAAASSPGPAGSSTAPGPATYLRRNSKFLTLCVAAAMFLLAGFGVKAL